MSVYLDTSCLLKLLVLEPESNAVRGVVAAEDDVVVSSLARLEAEVRLHAAYLGGRFRARQWKSYRDKLEDLIGLAPFRECSLAGSVFRTALDQVRAAEKTHCRSLDRLHLAAMQELRLRHLLTHDEAQAAAARALGYRVESPGRSPTEPS
jgi:hypothetical protein